MIKGITFDLDGVYFVNGKSNFIKNLINFGVDESEVKRVFLQSDEMNLLYKAGKMTDEEFWSWAIAEWGVEKSVEEIIEILISGYEVDQSVVDIVGKVRDLGYKTLVCTNNFPARIKGLQAKFGFLDNFDVKVLSYEVGSIKPQKEIFQFLIDKSGLKADEIFYADDYSAAIEIAGSLGIQTLRYENFDGFVAKLKELGVNL